LEVVSEGTPVHLANLMVQLKLLARIKAIQLEDPECAKIKQLLAEGKAKEFCLKEDELLTHFKQVCVYPNWRTEEGDNEQGSSFSVYYAS
jgi:hypothetical protein